MKKIFAVSFNFFFGVTAFSQIANISEILKDIQNTQANINTAMYSVERTDTLVTDDIRTMSGNVIIEKDNTDTLFGFRFWAKKDSDKSERIYDGHIGYETNLDARNYRLLNTGQELRYLLYNGGAQVVVPELIHIDTSGVKKTEVSEDNKYYYLTFYYPDLTQYDVIKRRKIITIDKLTMLPASVRSHQETYGKVQDLFFRITDIKIDQPLTYDFETLPFLKAYVQFIPAERKNPILNLKNKPAPAFNLNSLDGKAISSEAFKGKVVLLDFWEVWCGPCIESMPKVHDLYEKYKAKGFQVYGIVNDLRSVQAIREFVKKRSIRFPVLMGDEQLKKDYKLDGSVPLYILINKKGEIIFVQPGYSTDMESIIKKELE
ncbi:MAG: TlpA family protein disulfide reductase [Bacteroidia bacterium]|nr:TlpA family protein disulfide reductase [Bacteroidia bacterium]